MADDSSVAQADLAAILRALGLPAHARQESPHEVVQTMVLPAIRRLRDGEPVAGQSDPCADIPDAPQPEPYRPPPGAWARWGRKKPKNLYLVTPDHPEGLDVGRMDTPELGVFAVEAFNHYLGTLAGEALDSDRTIGGIAGAPYPELCAIGKAAVALLEGRNAGHPELIHQELRRMRTELDRAIRAVEDLVDGNNGGGGQG